MRVITPESNRIIHPEGKQSQKEKEEDPCGQKKRLRIRKPASELASNYGQHN